MKKLFLSFFAVMLAVFSMQAEEVTYTVDFSEYSGSSTQYKEETHDLGGGLSISIKNCHINTQLRIYSSGSYNGYVISDALPGTITSMSFNMGHNKDNLIVYGSTDGSTWVKVGSIATTTTSYKDYTLAFTDKYTYFKLDVEGTQQIRIASMTITYTTGDSGEGGGEAPDPEEPETPVTPPTEGEEEQVVDLLDRATTGITSTSYTAWSGKTATSDAVYAGQSAGGNSSIQLRSDKSNSGIITTVSGGKAKKITVEWNTNTASSRTLNIYGKNTAYTNPTDLYSTSTQGTLLGTIVCGTSTELVIDGDYEYIGLRSASGAMYLTSISITWEKAAASAKLPSVSVTTETTIELNSKITIIPATDNKVSYSINGVAQDDITEATEITANEAGVMTLVLKSTYGESTTEEATYTYYVKPAMPEIKAESSTFTESIEVTIEAAEGTIYYTIDGNDPTTENPYNDSFTIYETTTVKAIAVVGGVESDIKTVTYTKLKAAIPGYTIDTLTAASFTATSTTYEDFESVNFNSNAVYAGNSAKTSENAIQLRSSEHSGIVTTVSGGKAKKIIVKWNSETIEERTLDIYGKNTAYTNPTDLYSTSTQGTKLGSIVYGTSTELVIDGDYEYIGLRSASGAMYIDEIQITWANPYKLKVSDAGYATLFLDFPVAIPENVEVYTVNETTNTSVVLNKLAGVLSANTGVIVKAEENTYTFWPSSEATADVTGNLLKGTIEATVATEDIYVLANVDGNVGLYKAKTENGDFTIKANRAYLPASALTAEQQQSVGFRFDFGTTAVEKVEMRNEKEEIYDLQGRRINEITQPGIYVVGGVKRVVK